LFSFSEYLPENQRVSMFSMNMPFYPKSAQKKGSFILSTFGGLREMFLLQTAALAPLNNNCGIAAKGALNGY